MKFVFVLFFLLTTASPVFSADMTARETLLWINSTLISNAAPPAEFSEGGRHTQIMVKDGNMIISLFDHSSNEKYATYEIDFNYFVKHMKITYNEYYKIGEIETECDNCITYSHKSYDWKQKKLSDGGLFLASDPKIVNKVYKAIQYLHKRTAEHHESIGKIDELPF